MSELVQYNAHLVELRATVARLDTVDEAKELADKAAAAQTWARRVRLGGEAVNHAAEVKLRAERRAGELLVDTVEHGGDRRSVSSSDATRLNDLGITHDQSSQWQSLAAIPEPDFDAAIEAEKAEGQLTRSGVARRAMDVHYSSTTPEWATPQELYDLLNEEFQFELDVCATDENAKAPTWYTEKENGLEQPWAGVCWMNPPYGDVIAKWVEKAYRAGQEGSTVVCLLPARVDTGWWWNYCRHGEIRLLRGRLKFGGADTGAPFPSAVVIFGREPNGLHLHWEKWRAA